jgi:hypothetical protein
MYQATGNLKVIFDTQTFPSGFTKREFVITTRDENYPQDTKFELVKDKCEWLDNYQEGQEVTVSFDVRGNEYKEKYYVNLNAWKIESAGQQEQPTQPQGNQHKLAGSQMPARSTTQLQDVNQPQNISGAGEVLENDQVPF